MTQNNCLFFLLLSLNFHTFAAEMELPKIKIPPTKRQYVQLVSAVVLVLFVIRLCKPGVIETTSSETAVATTDSVGNAAPTGKSQGAELLAVNPMPRLDFSHKHRIRSVHSYRECFPDLQEIQYPVACANGVPPVENRADAEQRKKDLLFVGANPYYQMDPAMRSSIPYLVPKASHLLQQISRRFLDSLAVKGIPLHKLIVTSVLRTEEDVRRLRRINGNASEQSCHRFGTTFDISYNRYHTVAPPEAPHRRAVRNDSLKFVLAEVLRDIREEGLCYVKYEVKQGCFHITVR